MKKFKYFLDKLKIYSCQKYCLKSNIGIGRPSSFPFVSGDTYRSVSDLIIENTLELKEFENFICSINFTNLVVYISGTFVENNETDIFDFFKKIESMQKKFKVNLIVHDYDRDLPDIFFQKASSVFNKIYAINIQSKLPYIINIPLGLENAFLQRSGLPELYRNHNKLKIYSNVEKSNLLFSAFNISTNVQEREKLKFLIEKYNYQYSGANVSSKDYLDHLSKSYFTLSPKGNGRDCHRTWEAIYLDCVPVILVGTLSIELEEILPILVVKNWEDFLIKSEAELSQIYSNLIIKKTEKSYAPYWINEFRRFD